MPLLEENDERAYERDGDFDFAGLLVLDLSLDLESSLSRLEDFRAGEGDRFDSLRLLVLRLRRLLLLELLVLLLLLRLLVGDLLDEDPPPRSP